MSIVCKQVGWYRKQVIYADMAQEVEHVLGKDEVAGSNPAISSSEKSRHFRRGKWRLFAFIKQSRAD